MPQLKYIFDYEEVIVRYTAGDSINAIGQDIGVPPHVIYRQLSKYKKNWNGRKRRTGIEPMPLDIEALKKLQDEGHTLKQIAAMYNCSAATIFRRLGYKHAGHHDTATPKKAVLLEFKGLDGLDICVRPEDIKYIQRCPTMNEDHGKLCVRLEERVFTIVDYHDAVMKWRNALRVARGESNEHITKNRLSPPKKI
jgi:transposase